MDPGPTFKVGKKETALISTDRGPAVEIREYRKNERKINGRKMKGMWNK
jgi:hypothetical protein